MYPAIVMGHEYRVLLEMKNSDLRRLRQIQIEYCYEYLNLKKNLGIRGIRSKSNDARIDEEYRYRK